MSALPSCNYAAVREAVACDTRCSWGSVRALAARQPSLLSVCRYDGMREALALHNELKALSSKMRDWQPSQRGGTPEAQLAEIQVRCGHRLSRTRP